MPDTDPETTERVEALWNPGLRIIVVRNTASGDEVQFSEKAWDAFLARRSPEQMLREFHSTAGLPLPDQPTAHPELGSQTGRAKILAEEVRELGDAIEAGDIIEIADACADVAYAVVGTAVTYGIPFDAVFRAVHVSNMTKLIPPVVINGDGKIVKGPGYEPPDIDTALGQRGGKPVDR